MRGPTTPWDPLHSTVQDTCITRINKTHIIYVGYKVLNSGYVKIALFDTERRKSYEIQGFTFQKRIFTFIMLVLIVSHAKNGTN